MEIVKPSVEVWLEGDDKEAHIEKCAAVCYATKKFVKGKIIDVLTKDGHMSMFRHATHYYIVSYNSAAGKTILDYNNLCRIFGKNPLFGIYCGRKAIYVCANYQFVIEHKHFNDLISKYEVSIDQFAESSEDKELLRLTLCCVSSIKVSRELNRVSPNNIAEQSTRYVNFISKNGDVAVCESFEPEYLTAVDRAIIHEDLNQACDNYTHLIESGVKPEDARRVLPLDTATKCVYTYTVSEWKHILDLRFFEKTGKAAPDAKIIGAKIYEILKNLGYYD